MTSGALLQTAVALPPSPVATTQSPLHRARTARNADPVGGRSPDLPTAIGRFVVLRRLGEGGMGVVVAAFDEALDRKLAIKLRHERLGDDDATVRTRMLREAQAMARLSHPNVVQIYEVGEHEGQLYVAMEFVRGQTLREWQSGPPRRWSATVAMYMQAAQGLAAAHAAGVVHRDFKPENVLVGEDGRARVLDFGLARHATGADAPRAAEPAEPGRTSPLALGLTQAGVLMGTPAYMSPEQFRGDPAGPASDQFSFCVALYEALFGHLPFDGATWQELAANVLEGVARPPPVTAEIPEALRAALLRGLESEPERRHPSIEALLGELAALVTPDGAPRRAVARWWPLALLAALAAGVPSLALLAREPPAAAPVDDAVERLSERARGAASQLRWVIPSRGDPTDTAYQRVLELEALGTAPALERARLLRREFSDALREIGDYYWGIDGSKAFARDFYIQAVIFTPDVAELSDRSGRTSGELADLRARAAEGLFTRAELLSAGIVVALAQPDGEKAAEQLAAIEAAEHEPSLLLAENLRRVRQIQATRPSDRGARSPEEVTRGAGLATPLPEAIAREEVKTEAPPLAEPAPAEPPPPPPPLEPAARPPKPDADERPSVADVARAAIALQSARAAAERGAVGEAERLYRQALDLDPDSVDALVGLSDLHFERSAYALALTFAQRAQRLAPKDAAVRLRLGDAYFKLMRYTQARKQYEAARDLGDPHAAARLAKLDAMVGAEEEP